MNVENNKELKAVESYARILDSKFSVPGTDIRFGFDFLIGLIPYGGHLITFIFLLVQENKVKEGRS